MLGKLLKWTAVAKLIEWWRNRRGKPGKHTRD